MTDEYEPIRQKRSTGIIGAVVGGVLVAACAGSIWVGSILDGHQIGQYKFFFNARTSHITLGSTLSDRDYGLAVRKLPIGVSSGGRYPVQSTFVFGFRTSGSSPFGLPTNVQLITGDSIYEVLDGDEIIHMQQSQ